MSKQVYIDSNGNEVQVSGTVNTADMMPMSASDSTKVSEAIGDLSDLTTSVKSSLVGAVNEVVTGLGTKAKITRKKYSVTLASNTFVAPFTYFYGLDITTDSASYGSPIGVWCDNAAVLPHIQNSNRVDFAGNSALTCDVYVFFASNIDVIS